MAYMSQERKAQIAERLKPILKQYDVKGTLSVWNNSTIVLTITKGPIDFIGNNLIAGKGSQDVKAARTSGGYMDVNPYWFQEQFDGIALEFIRKVNDAMNLSGDKDANFDRSDLMSDYFDVGWYVDINIGKYGKPYQLTGAPVAVPPPAAPVPTKPVLTVIQGGVR